MADEIPRLRVLLEELHGELSRLPPFGMDEAQRTQLLGLQTDVERLLARDEAGPDVGMTVPHEQKEHLRSRLQSVVAGFEDAHPKLASAVEQTMNALSNMGL